MNRHDNTQYDSAGAHPCHPHNYLGTTDHERECTFGHGRVTCLLGYLLPTRGRHPPSAHVPSHRRNIHPLSSSPHPAPPLLPTTPHAD
eukprot:2786743-Rhodomonas_salina.2